MKYLEPKEILEIQTDLFESQAFSAGIDRKTGKPIVVFCDDKGKPIIGIRFVSLDDVNEFVNILEKKAWEQEHGER